MYKNSQKCCSFKLPPCFCMHPRTLPRAITCNVQQNGGAVESNDRSDSSSAEGRLNNFHEENSSERGENSLGISRDVKIPGDSVAVMSYSTDPYVEFRQAMMEMLEDRLERKQVVDWDYLEELLTSYLELNKRDCQEDILKAYVDVVMEFFQL